ncbi:hypothetical protein LJB98_01670 [Bacteroidales bacterium OttesenSCG-928-M11]|nr:hypothetical protein [Bacteroidales bacterium OttesenSCG-928-M11]
MIKILLTYNYGVSWYSEEGIYVKGKALLNDTLLKEKSLADYFKTVDSTSDFEEKVRLLNGLFAVIVHKGGEVFAAVDKLRSIPLLYITQENDLFLSDDFYLLSSFASSHTKDEEVIRFDRSFGFTPGEHTLIKEIKQLQTGEYLYYNASRLEVKDYYTLPKINPITENEAEKKFLKIIEETAERLITQIENRPVALPLSGGFDSRLIGLMLKNKGKRDVTCFTFGNKNDKEALVSEKIAKQLGYDWFFIDYKKYIGENYLDSSLFEEYVRFFSNGVSFPFLQEYFAGRYLKENKIFSEDTILLPGHSGDMVGGSHLYPDMNYFKSKRKLAINLCNRSGDSIPLDKKEREQLVRNITQYLNFNLNSGGVQLTHQNHDEWNCRERQSKHIINSSKAWNFFGYEFLLPLWDDEFVSFLLALPFSMRVNKNMYDKVLVSLFKQNNLFLEEETPPSAEQHRKNFLKKKIREDYPLINRIKPKKHFAHDFFYLKELLQPMIDEMPDYPYNNGIGILSEWYIRSVLNKNETKRND